MTDPFEHLDGAYVLGALSPAERREFEEHLAACPGCTARVDELATVLPYLAAVPAAEFDIADEPPPATLLPSMLARAARRRRRERVRLAGLGATAAAAVATLVVVLWPQRSPSEPPARAMQAARAGVPVSASVRLVTKKWGTEIDVRCRYTKSGEYKARPYLLIITDRGGEHHKLGAWKLGPGDQGTFRSPTALDPSQIAQVSIEAPGRGTVLSLNN